MLRFLAAPILLAACSTAPMADAPIPAPRISYHQHLISPPTATLWGDPNTTLDAAGLIAQLDEAGIERGVVLSVGYTWGDERKQVDDPPRRTREENDWTSAQVMRFPRRLVGFCSVNPLREEALAEIERCLALPGMRGLKLHIGNSGVNVREPAHVARLREVFALANRLHAPIVVHARPRGSMNIPYGREDATIFLEQVLPAAPDVVVQLAHMAGAGPGYPESSDAAMQVYAAAFAAHDPRVRRLYFDITTAMAADSTPEEAALMVSRMRAIGMDRFLFGADLAISGNPTPAQAWVLFVEKATLTRAEFTIIARNIAPYMR